MGNGIYTHFDGTTIMNGGEISENTGGEYGGGIYSDGTVIINNGDIINNQAGQGGGLTSHGLLTLYGGNISNNTAGAGGGTKSAERLSATMIDPIHSEKISAYPSLLTSGGMLTIDSPDGGAASVWNMSGMMVGRHKLSDGKTQVSASYPAGNYVVKVKTGTGKEKDIKIIVK